jgi:hypothetical protein
MTVLLPRTLGISLLREIGCVNVKQLPREELLKRLNEKPELLLLFYKQAIKDSSWAMSQEEATHFLQRVFCEIRKKVILKTMALSCIFAFLDEIFLSSQLMAISFAEQDLKVKDKNRSETSISSLVLMRNNPGVHEKLLLHKGEMDLSELAPRLTIDEFKCLYYYFVRQEIEILIHLGVRSVWKLMLQLHEWGNKKELLVCDEQFCESIHTFINALEYYHKAMSYQFTFTQKKCREVLEKEVGYVMNPTGQKAYLFYNPILEANNLLIRTASKYELKLKYFPVEEFTFTLVSEDVLTLQYRLCGDEERQRNSEMLEKIPYERIADLKLLGLSKNVSISFIFSLISMLPNLKYVSLNNMANLDEGFFGKLKGAAPKLISLSLIETVLSEKMIRTIVHLFPSLEILNLASCGVEGLPLGIILSEKYITGLTIAFLRKVVIPEEASYFAHIQIFNMEGATFANPALIPNLFKCAVSLRNLCVIGVKDFKCAFLLNAHNLTLLSLSAEHFDVELPKDDNGIRKTDFFNLVQCTRLKMMEVKGRLTDRAKKAVGILLRCRPDIKISFVDAQK